MPDIVQAFLIYLIVQGLKGLGRAVGVDLSGMTTLLAVALAGALVTFYSAIVSALPPEWASVAHHFMALIAAILVASGFHYETRRLILHRPDEEPKG
ncbi:MAG: hypothetical protein RML46_06575 [Anaerolineae bacterium]|nr:hypothetical protein [Anaerolineae bacterium]